MKKIISSVIVILILGGIVLWYKFGTSASVLATAPAPLSSGTSAPSENTNPAAGGPGTGSTDSSGSSPGSGSIAPQGKYKDGVYTGVVSTNIYGPVQVSATISGGKLAGVAFLQHPHDQRESQQISAEAMPQLKSEAIAAQSAQVDTVSGATQTSESFVESLGSALSQAQV